MEKKIILTMTDEDNDSDMLRYLNGPKYAIALWEISQEIFRPARKHGYSDRQVNEYLDGNDTYLAIGRLEEMFFEILAKHNLEID